MRKMGLDESQVGIKIAGRNNNLRYSDDTTLMAESEDKLKSFLMWVKEESTRVGLKPNIKKTKIMASGPLTSWQIDGEEMELVKDFVFLGSKITADGDCSQEIKRHLLLGRKAMANLDSILKSGDITLPTKVQIVKAMVFPVAMYGSYPHWMERLNDTQLDSGEQLRWECKAMGKPRPTYRWLKNGAPLWPENYVSIPLQSRIEMLNGVLMIHSVNQSDAGMYQCVAENKHGAIYASAELRILASAPAFPLSQLKKTIIITKGQEVAVECKPEGSPKPTISWKKGDKAVRENKRSDVSPLMFAFDWMNVCKKAITGRLL
ncbi:Contactin-5 [Varanus komodoensis]|nr:Contactin-5 [Varanus komodoensis]